MDRVDLGFAEEQDSWLLTNRYFPSKIGGRVAWLELENILDSQELSCQYCGESCIFLCQIYAPSEKNVNAFHRTIFVFVCINGGCYTSNQSGNIKILRSQLPLKNNFYPDVPPDESIEAEEIAALCKLCNVCGCKAPMICGKCKKVNYCGQLHQKRDWKSHKKVCGKENILSGDSDVHFPEYEIVIEPEERDDKTSRETEKEAEMRRLREYEDLVKQGQIKDMNDITEKDLQEFAESKEDKAFGKFKKIIEDYPTQVIRYNRNGSPLWISSGGISNKNVPNCSNCGGRRTFEFQIMPQMLNELKNCDLDWGVIAIFTCENDCNTNGKYVQEFCYKQDISKSDDNEMFNAELNNVHIRENHSKKEVPKVKNENLPETSKAGKKKITVISSQKAFEESDNWE